MAAQTVEIEREQPLVEHCTIKGMAFSIYEVTRPYWPGPGKPETTRTEYRLATDRGEWHFRDLETARHWAQKLPGNDFRHRGPKAYDKERWREMDKQIARCHKHGQSILFGSSYKYGCNYRQRYDGPPSTVGLTYGADNIWSNRDQTYVPLARYLMNAAASLADNRDPESRGYRPRRSK